MEDLPDDMKKVIEDNKVALSILGKEGKKATQFLIPVREDTKRMLELLKFEAQVRDRKRVSYDELVKELMACGSVNLAGEPTQKP